jgi:hypothetical protein
MKSEIRSKLRITCWTDYLRTSCCVTHISLLTYLLPLHVPRREECSTECEALIIHRSRYRCFDCASVAQVSFSNYSQTHTHTYCILYVKINLSSKLFNNPASSVKISNRRMCRAGEYHWSMWGVWTEGVANCILVSLLEEPEDIQEEPRLQ